MDDLFIAHEERLPRCAAVRVDDENIDRVARYYRDWGYETVISRDKEGMRLAISNSNRSEPYTVTALYGDVLIQGDPPRVMSHAEFRHKWKPIKQWEPGE